MGELFLNLVSFLMAGESVVTGVSTILEAVLSEAIERIAKKIREGKKLTDSEIVILLLQDTNKRINDTNKRIDDLGTSLSQRINDTNKRIDDFRISLNKRIDDVDRKVDELKGSINKRIDDTNKRIDELKGDIRALTREVSSIKSDIINLLKQKI